MIVVNSGRYLPRRFAARQISTTIQLRFVKYLLNNLCAVNSNSITDILNLIKNRYSCLHIPYIKLLISSTVYQNIENNNNRLLSSAFSTRACAASPEPVACFKAKLNAASSARLTKF